MKKIITTLAFFAAANLPFGHMAWAQEEVPDTRIRLLLATIETPDTRSDGFLKVVTLPKPEKPYSDADLGRMSGSGLSRAQEENADAARAHRRANAQIFYEEYRRRVALQEEIARKAKTTAAGRNLILARDWFAANMHEHGELFETIFRMDDQEAQEEKFYTETDALDVAKSSYFVKIVVNDPKETKSTKRMPGGNMLTRTTTKQLVTIHIQDLKNKMVFSKDFEAEKVSGESSVVMKSGDDDVLGTLLRECLKMAAKGIAEKFSVKLVVKLKGPKGDEDFDADNATLTLNGREVSVGEAITCVKAEYEVKVEMDGYQTYKKKFDFASESGTVTKTISLVKEKSE